MLMKDNIFDLLAVTVPTGQQTHQEANFTALLEPKLRKVFYETYDELPEQYSKVLHVNKSTKAKETDYGVGAMSPWSKFGSNYTAGAITSTNPMPTISYQTIPAGLERTYIHEEFASGFVVERKFIDDEQYGVIEKMTKDLARAGRYKVENDAVTLFNNGFSKDVGGTGKSAIYDGKALFAADHPLLNTGVTTAHGTGICSNLATGALSDTTLKNALLMGRKQYDEAGKLIQMNFDTLIVPPDLEFLAYELIRSSQKIGTSDNDVNSLKGRLKIEVWDFLSSSTAWFIADSTRHQLNFFWRTRPDFGQEKDFESFVTKWSGYMRYSFGASDYRGIIGSTGV